MHRLSWGVTAPVLILQPAPLDLIVPVLRASSLDREARRQPMWTPESLSAEALAEQYPDGQAYAGRLEGEVVAAMILLPTDPHFWPGDPPGEALYLHKLAVHPQWQGRGLARQMLDGAVRLTQHRGRPWLRLDTAAERPALRALYEDYGFRLMREGQMQGWPAAWYELNVSARP